MRILWFFFLMSYFEESKCKKDAKWGVFTEEACLSATTNTAQLS